MAHSAASGALMRSFGALVLAFFLSGVVAGAVQIQLGVTFKADLELVLAMVTLAVMTVVTTVALGLALAFARKAAVIDAVAVGIVGLIVLALALFPFVTGAGMPARSDVPILAEILVPIGLMIAIQWWLIRRRWRRARTA
jgi:hypothetical protein